MICYLISNHILLYYTISYYIKSYHIILYCIILYCIILYYIILYYIILYYIILYYIILYYIILYYIHISTPIWNCTSKQTLKLHPPWQVLPPGVCAIDFLAPRPGTKGVTSRWPFRTNEGLRFLVALCTCPRDPSTFLGSVWGIIYYSLEGQAHSQTVFGSIGMVFILGLL